MPCLRLRYAATRQFRRRYVIASRQRRYYAVRSAITPVCRCCRHCHDAASALRHAATAAISMLTLRRYVICFAAPRAMSRPPCRAARRRYEARLRCCS